MRRMVTTAVAVATAMAAAASADAGTVAASASVLGIWSNPKGTLAVRTLPCGPASSTEARELCGAIVRAGPTAVADAKEAGVAQLVGTQLLQGYRAIGRASWSGRVFLPDMGRSFPSRIRLTGNDELTISGCLIGGFLCRSQAWHRVG